VLQCSANSGADLRQSRLEWWISTFCLRDPIGALRHTWLHGLLTAQLLDAFLSEPKVALIGLRNIGQAPAGAFYDHLQFFDQLLLTPADGVDLPQLQQSLSLNTLTPAGRMLVLFASAAQGMHQATRLAIASDPADLAWGWLFTASGSRPGANLLLVNLSPQALPVDLTALKAHLPPLTTWVGASVTLRSAPPAAFISGVNRPDFQAYSLNEVQVTISEDHRLTLPPYSVAAASAQLLRGALNYLPLVSKER
jgi:hypothetical protein